jgi:preprotein translocase subunit SecY
VAGRTSLIIFAGIVAELPRSLVNTLALGKQGALSAFGIIAIAVVAVAVTVFIVFVERSQRRLVVQYPKRQVGNRMFMGENSFLPLKINTSGVIPPIFASSLLLLPSTIIGFVGQSANAPEWLTSLLALIGYGQPLHMAIYAFGIIFFCFFYTSIVFNPEETADNLRKYGGLSRLCADAPYRYRRGLHHDRLFDPGIADLVLQGAVLSRRHLAADRCVGDDGYRVANPVAFAGPPI